MPYADKYVSQVSDIPETEHWAIVKTDGVYIPGDERSRTNPGHGYPAEIRNFLSYEVYFTEAKLLEAIEELEKPLYGGNRTAYKVIKVTPAKITTKTQISIGS